MLNFLISFLKIQQFLSYKGLFIFSSTWDIHFSISQWNHYVIVTFLTIAIFPLLSPFTFTTYESFLILSESDTKVFYHWLFNTSHTLKQVQQKNGVYFQYVCNTCVDPFCSLQPLYLLQDREKMPNLQARMC